MQPQQDAPVVSVTYGDNIKVELVPAYVDMIGRDAAGNVLGTVGRGYWVPKNGTWQMADYDYEAEHISRQNTLSSDYLVPVIKMLKAIRRKFFPTLESFPLEIITAKIIPVSVAIRQASGTSILYRDLLLDFFEGAHPHLAAPIVVPGSKSKPIVLDQTAALTTTRMFNRISNHIKATNLMGTQAEKINAWRTLFNNEHFPTVL